MKSLLNSEQQSSVKIVLRMFEENLREVETWLQGAEVNGILYQRRLNLPAAKREAVQQCVDAALEIIAALARKFDLKPEVEDVSNMIRSRMSIRWADLADTQSRKLKRFGEVPPELKRTLDPDIQQLARLALELASIIEKDPGAENGSKDDTR